MGEGRLQAGNYLSGKGQHVLHPRFMTSWALSFEEENPEMAPPFPSEAPLASRLVCLSPSGREQSHSIQGTSLIGQDSRVKSLGPPSVPGRHINIRFFHSTHLPNPQQMAPAQPDQHTLYAPKGHLSQHLLSYSVPQTVHMPADRQSRLQPPGKGTRHTCSHP